jgi:hypothetical protein
MTKNFLLPIELNDKKKLIKKNLLKDLELLHTDTSKNGVYQNIFKPNDKYTNNILETFAQYYTTDKDFLNDTQILNKKYVKHTNDDEKIKNTIKIWDSIILDDDFLEKFQFITWDPIKILNEYSLFLSAMTFYSISSPVLNLAAPIVMLIIPFFIIKIMGLPITIPSYTNILMKQLNRLSFMKLFTASDISIQARLYYLFCFGMYFYNIYQNIQSCISFYKNTKAINKNFEAIDSYFNYTLEKLDDYIDNISELKSYSKYKEYLETKKNNVEEFIKALKSTPRFSMNPINLFKSGITMKQYYLLYDRKHIDTLFQFTFDFHSYLIILKNFSDKVEKSIVSPAIFSNNEKPYIKFKNVIYPNIENEFNIPNTISIKNNQIITGPNASGKTTLLKAIIINLLLSQQTGYGFFEYAKFTPYDNIYCYLNIPDNCSRDSLFQAEARRCYSILKDIEDKPDEKHFCVFDELFSGTNPYEAIASAKCYLEYISKNKNITFLLTTHFDKLCKLLDKQDNIDNKHMSCEIIDNKPKYYYKIKDGITTVKGGICVLQELNYPPEIIKNTKKILSQI